MNIFGNRSIEVNHWAKVANKTANINVQNRSFIFVSRPVSLYTVIDRVESRFRKDHTKRDEHLLKMLQTVSNHESSVYPTVL